MFDTADDPIDIPTCTCCPRELHGADYGRLACVKCEDRMYDQLNDVGTYWAKLPDTAHRPVGEREPGRSMSVYPGIPGNGNVINLTAGGDDTPLGKLLAVEDDWRRAAGYQPRKHYGRPVKAMPEVLKFLRRHLRWACEAHKNPPMLEDGSPLLPDVEALSKALGKAVGELKHAVTGEPGPRAMTVRCFAEWDDGAVCGSELRIPAPYLRAECPGCGAVWTRGAFLCAAEQANQFGAAA